MSLVSIILPYYKKINFFTATYKSIINQSYQNYELIIVYDDEDDFDLKKIKKITLKNPKVKIICNKKNLGAGLSRNIGIKNSKGKLVAFIDADDLWNKNKIRDQIEFIKKLNCKFVSCDYIKNYKNKTIKVNSKYKITYWDLIKSCSIGLSTVMVKKEIIDNKLFSNLKTQEDFSAWLKIMRKNKISCYNLEKTLVIWNHDNNSLSSNFIQKIKDAFNVFRIKEKFSLIDSLFYLFVLSFNSLKRKFKFN